MEIFCWMTLISKKRNHDFKNHILPFEINHTSIQLHHFCQFLFTFYQSINMIIFIALQWKLQYKQKLNFPFICASKFSPHCLSHLLTLVIALEVKLSHEYIFCSNESFFHYGYDWCFILNLLKNLQHLSYWINKHVKWYARFAYVKYL